VTKFENLKVGITLVSVPLKHGLLFATFYLQLYKTEIGVVKNIFKNYR